MWLSKKLKEHVRRREVIFLLIENVRAGMNHNYSLHFRLYVASISPDPGRRLNDRVRGMKYILICRLDITFS